MGTSENYGELWGTMEKYVEPCKTMETWRTTDN